MLILMTPLHANPLGLLTWGIGTNTIYYNQVDYYGEYVTVRYYEDYPNIREHKVNLIWDTSYRCDIKNRPNSNTYTMNSYMRLSKLVLDSIIGPPNNTPIIRTDFVCAGKNLNLEEYQGG